MNEKTRREAKRIYTAILDTEQKTAISIIIEVLAEKDREIAELEKDVAFYKSGRDERSDDEKIQEIVELEASAADDVIISMIFAELREAEVKFPGWPKDVIHGTAIMIEEAGEAMKAALDLYYGRGDCAKLQKEIAQTGAMAIRLLVYLSRFFQCRSGG